VAATFADLAGADLDRRVGLTDLGRRMKRFEYTSSRLNNTPAGKRSMCSTKRARLGRRLHRALDWMFSVELAWQAERAFTNAGAKITYREIADLSHTYPREMNALLLAWLKNTAAG
jgi:hypothetical protein